jgi:hypothetical protein
MLYDQLRELAMHADWRQLTVGSAALAVGACMVAAGLIASKMRIKKRMQAIETQLSQMQNEIAALLQVQTALITKLNIKSREAIDRRDIPGETADGEVIGLTVSPPTTPAQSEGARAAKLPD